jgi:hypothetical protein
MLGQGHAEDVRDTVIESPTPDTFLPLRPDPTRAKFR